MRHCTDLHTIIYISGTQRCSTRVQDLDSSPVFWDLDLDLDLRPVDSDLDLRPMDLDLDSTPPDLRLGLN